MINFKNITKSFGSNRALSNVSLMIEKGESLALLGPNGAGKTTLVRLLLNFINPDSGSITISGRPVSDPDSRSSIGYLAESHRIPPFLTGYEYLKRHSKLIGLSKKEGIQEIERVLEVVSMKDDARKKTGSYSKGMVQRIGLGSALMGSPELLVLDEPVSGLDPIGIREFRVILEDLNQKGVTVIVNSHLLSETEKSCRSVGIINKGQLLVKDEIESIVGEDETLEDVFMKVIGR